LLLFLLLLLPDDINVSVADTKPMTHHWQKFVAATETEPKPSPPPMPTTTATTLTADDENDVTQSSSVTSKSVSAMSVGAEQKDEIDIKLQDFLAVCQIVFIRILIFALWVQHRQYNTTDLRQY